MTRFIFANNSGRKTSDEYEQESGNREIRWEGYSPLIWMRITKDLYQTRESCMHYYHPHKKISQR